MQIDQPAGDERVDPGAWVGVKVDDELVGFAGGGCDEDDDCYEPVEEEL